MTLRQAQGERKRIASLLEGFDAEFGAGSAARDLKTGAFAIGLLCVNLIGWLVVAGGAQ